MERLLPSVSSNPNIFWLVLHARHEEPVVNESFAFLVFLFN